MNGLQKTIFLCVTVVVGGALGAVAALASPGGIATALVGLAGTAIGGAVGAYQSRDKPKEE